MYHHARSLSPDPLYAMRGKPLPGGASGIDLYPHACVRVAPEQASARPWARRLNLFQQPAALQLKPDAAGRLDLVVDFGTEMEAALEIECTVPACNLFVSFGESIPEVETWGEPTDHPLQTRPWRIESAGRHRRSFETRGFRFVRLQGHDFSRPLLLHRLVAHAWLPFRQRQGDFLCSDDRFQRVWQTSLYTARLCTRPDGYWDGIKRDRNGWYGDARIIQQAIDNVFHDPAPAAGMLPRLPTDQWTMGIPGFSFDAIAMLRQFILCYGLKHPAVRETYARVRRLLAWAKRTQTNRQGFIIRDAKTQYFGEIAFVDWSPMPVGGKFEELSWLQCKYVEALRHAAQIARWLGESRDAAAYQGLSDDLARKIIRTFWRPGTGLVHTLNQTTRKWEPLLVLTPLGGDVFRRHWFENPPLGPSGPSRHAYALAAWAGVLTTPAMRAAALRVFGSRRLPRLITPYFLYYEQWARAECGEPTEALLAMRDFVGAQIEENDSATVWEWYEPEIQDLHKWRLGDWPKSLCHGWGGGPVPLASRYLLGIQPQSPGFDHLALRPAVDLPWSFEATLPTPHGPIRVRQDAKGAAVHYDVPPSITLVGELSERVVVHRRRS